MVRFILRIALFVAAMLAMPHILPGIEVEDEVVAVIAAIILSILNATLRPILKLISFPVNFFTFGLFTLVINGVILFIVSIMVEGFTIDGALPAFVGALMISAVSMVADALIKQSYVKKTGGGFD
ncbi:MAG: phage holin family protein [Deltaproteobacteria bacterium]|nr:phage holin family protein [Deltaproteobacteria bacterium]